VNLTPANDSLALATSAARFAMYPLAADFSEVPLVMSAGHRDAADNDNPAPFSVALNADSPATLQALVTAMLQQLEPGAAPTGWTVRYGERGSVCTAVLTKRRAGGAR